MELVVNVLGHRPDFMDMNLNLSHYVNGVAKKHGEVSRHMFGGYEIDAITNGVSRRNDILQEFRDSMA